MIIRLGTHPHMGTDWKYQCKGMRIFRRALAMSPHKHVVRRDGRRPSRSEIEFQKV